MTTMEDSVKLVAELMAISARTAPKAIGNDFIDIKVLFGDEIKKLGESMLNIAEERKVAPFERDGNNVLNSSAVVLIGLRKHPAIGLNCGACGFDCKEFEEQGKTIDFDGPNCIWRVIDLGIAIGSAVKTASMMNVDNRIMYRIGVAARQTGMMRSPVVIGIPLSATGKNIYFDR